MLFDTATNNQVARKALAARDGVSLRLVE